MNVHSRVHTVARVASALMMLATSAVLAAPAFAQQTPAPASTDTSAWKAGPGAAGDNTFIGRIEAPARTATIAAGAPALVTGWVVDDTAQGWAGVDGLQVWNGLMGSGGSQVATGTVAGPRPDVRDALANPYWLNSGFAATIPASALKAGAASFNVYIHTPGKGWWYKAVSFNVAEAVALAYPNDPIVAITGPQQDQFLTQGAIRQQGYGNPPPGSSGPGNYTFGGFALDENLPTGPNSTGGVGVPGRCGASTDTGITSVALWLDGTSTRDPNAINLGPATYGVLNPGPVNAAGWNQVQNGTWSTFSRQYGDRFLCAGWVLTQNLQNFPVGPHTLYAIATSSVTGIQHTASVNFQIVP